MRRRLIPNDELTSLFKKRKEAELIPENQKVYDEWRTFAKQVHNDYLNFLLVGFTILFILKIVKIISYLHHICLVILIG